MCPEPVRPANEVRSTFKRQSGAPVGTIDLSVARPPYLTLYCGEDETDRSKDMVAAVFYSRKKAPKVSVMGTFLTTRKHWEAFRATMDQHFDFPRSPELRPKKPQVRTRAFKKKK
ncbi:MAG TPA: hypothetical protein VHD31_03320 [Candidatus Paceibacterota bacterium]|nr:hypothetical protein [Candidatus Paceibacterota bacterium]